MSLFLRRKNKYKKKHLKFSEKIITWYNENKRDLPWRNTNDAYVIWISEIILQQTRVAQGLSYFVRFLERFPDVNTLAIADENEVLKYWQGLGYYSRARNLHKSSKIVKELYQGVFPTKYEELLSLPGIGEYTAAAISSFSTNEPHAAIDGNVYRILARAFGIMEEISTSSSKKTFKSLAYELLDKKVAGIYNQAIMDFGALQCVPVNPQCDICPLASMCFAVQHNCVQNLPVKGKSIKQKERFFYYLDISLGEYTFLEQRTANDIWKKLFQFPLVELDKYLPINEFISNKKFTTLFKTVDDVQINFISPEIRHVLSHQIIKARFLQISIGRENDFLRSLIKIERKNFDDYTVPRLIEKYAEEYL